MEELLSFINSTLEDNNIPYEYGLWTSKITYPYCVGSLTENDYSFETDRTSGEFILDCWSRNSMLELTKIADKLSKIFADMQAIQDDNLFFVRFGGSTPIPTGERDLFRLSITLYTNRWKGTD